jgi:hypothetical protein
MELRYFHQPIFCDALVIDLDWREETHFALQVELWV